MKRKKQNIIAEQGENQFKTAKPKAWIYRPQHEEDIGIDGELEVIKNNISTGDIIKIQVKGTEDPKYIDNNSKISMELSASNAHYFCYELKIPVSIIVADLVNGKTYWCFPQLNEDFKRKVKKVMAQNQQNINIHIPVYNILPDAIVAFEERYYQCAVVLNTNNIIQTPPPEFFERISGVIDYGVVRRDFQNKIDIIKINEIHSFILSNNLVSAYKEIEKIIDNPQTTINTKFAAYVEIESIAGHRIKRHETTDKEYRETRLSVAGRLKSLTQKGPLQLKYFAALLYKTAQLFDLTKHDYSLFVASKVQRGSIDLLIPNFHHQRKIYVERLHRKYIHCMRLTRKCYEVGYYYLLPECSIRIIEAMVLFHLRLKLEELMDAAKRYRETIHNITAINCELATSLKQWDKLFALSLTYIKLVDCNDETEILDAEKLALSQINKIPTTEKRDQFLERFKQIKSNFFRPIEPVAPEEAAKLDIQTFTHLAEAHGIDLDDPEDIIAQTMSFGIKDYNPGRVLKNCQYLYIMLLGGGFVAQLFQLPTAGMKVLHCTRYRYAVQGRSLDMIWEGFERKYCNKCTDRLPHPQDWRWTIEWQQEKDRKFRNPSQPNKQPT
jgi:hypothetical protein